MPPQTKSPQSSRSTVRTPITPSSGTATSASAPRTVPMPHFAPVAGHVGTASGLTRLGSRELWRRFVHIGPGILPLILLPIQHRDPLSPTLLGIMSFFAVGLSALAIGRHQVFQRQGETSCLAAVLGYSVTIMTMLLLFPWQSELGLTVMGIMAFGDGPATLIGMLGGKRKLPWNPSKSWVGTIAFVACAIPMGTLIYWGDAQPGVSVTTALFCAAPAALVAAFAESLPSRINDNIRVGLAAAVTIIATHAILVGWQ